MNVKSLTQQNFKFVVTNININMNVNSSSSYTTILPLFHIVNSFRDFLF